jgi:PAS domain S-box-containing protein
VTAVPHYDEAGQLRNTIGIFRDITERMEAQATLRRRAAQLAVLNDIGREITGELSLEGLQQRAVELVQATFGYEHVTLLRLMLDTDQIQMVARAGEFAVLGPPDHTLDLGQGIIGWVCRHGETIVADDVRVDPRYLNLYPDRVQTRSELCVPIWVAGEVVGALDVQSTEIESFDENDVMVLETVADQVGVAIGNARLYGALRQDIEDRRKVETALRESQERLSLALEGGGLGPWDFNVQDKTIVYSRRWAEVLDYGPDEMPRHFDDWQALVHPDDRDQAKAKLNAHLDGKAPVYAAEYRIRAKDGTWRWLYSRGRVIGWDDEGRPLRAVGTHLDITQRKESEITLRELNTKLETLVSERTTELERERDKSNAILETTGDAIALVDRELAIEYVNPAFEDVTGYGAEEVCGLPIHKIVNPSYVPQDVITGMRRTVALEVDWDGEMPLRRKNGTTYDALIHIAPVRDGAGTVIGYLTSHRDISDLKALQRLQTRFINNVSHELRTPITILKLYAQMLSDAPPDKLTEYQQALVTEIDHLSNLVSDILRLNTVDSGNLELKPAPVSLNNLIKRRISQIWPTHDCEASPRLRLELSDPSPVALADPDWLLEALRHLLDNARDYTPSSGSVTILAGERAHGDQTWATITIQDTGSGIPQQELPLIFDRFFRGQQADDDQVSGTGLGLSLTKAIIGLQDGRITVESTLGSGSAFTVWLPIAPRRDDV